MKRNLKSWICVLMAAMIWLSGCGGGKATGGNVVSSGPAETTSTGTSGSEVSTKRDNDSMTWLTSQDWDAVEKKDTPLDFMGLGLSMPLDWTELEPYASDSEIEGDGVWSRGIGNDADIALSAEDLKDAELIPDSYETGIRLNGRSFDLLLGLTEAERYYMTFKECLSNDRFVLSSEYGSTALSFFGLPESIRTDADDEYFRKIYWFMDAVIEKYGKPDYISVYNKQPLSLTETSPRLYWERDGYYFGLFASELPEYNSFKLHIVEYIAASAWNSYLDGKVLVPFDEFIKEDLKHSPDTELEELGFAERYLVSGTKPSNPVDYPDIVDLTLAANVGLTEETTEDTSNNLTYTVFKGSDEGLASKGDSHEWGHEWEYHTDVEYQAENGRTKDISLEYIFYHGQKDDESIANRARLDVMVFKAGMLEAFDHLRDDTHTLLVKYDDRCVAYRTFRLNEDTGMYLRIYYDYPGDAPDTNGTHRFRSLCEVFGINPSELIG